jgi:hypothetical protein
MRTSRLAVLALALAALGIAGAAHAEPLAGGQILARAGEFRGDTHSLRGVESHIWRLAPNGQARAIVTIKRGLSALTGHTIETGDSGTWSVQGNTLCVDWQGENRRFSGCYSVEAQQGNHVRLVGPARWEGTLDR